MLDLAPFFILISYFIYTHLIYFTINIGHRSRWPLLCFPIMLLYLSLYIQLFILIHVCFNYFVNAQLHYWCLLSKFKLLPIIKLPINIATRSLRNWIHQLSVNDWSLRRNCVSLVIVNFLADPTIDQGESFSSQKDFPGWLQLCKVK